MEKNNAIIIPGDEKGLLNSLIFDYQLPIKKISCMTGLHERTLYRLLNGDISSDEARLQLIKIYIRQKMNTKHDTREARERKYNSSLIWGCYIVQ